MNDIRSTAALSIRQHRLVAYYVLACALAWCPWILYARGSSPAVIIGFGPFLAAMIVLAFTEGKQGVYELLRRMVQWRVHPSWYAVALLLPIVISTGAAMLNILLGAAVPSSQQVATWPTLAGTFAVLLLVPGIGGAWEEPGWRGYLTPQLEVRHRALTFQLDNRGCVGGLALSVVRKRHCWLVGCADDYSNRDCLCMAFNRSGGSVLILMLTHAMNNTMAWWRSMFSGADTTGEDFILLGPWCLVAVLVIALAGAEHLGLGNVADEPAPTSRRSLVTSRRPGAPTPAERHIGSNR